MSENKLTQIYQTYSSMDLICVQCKSASFYVYITFGIDLDLYSNNLQDIIQNDKSHWGGVGKKVMGSPKSIKDIMCINIYASPWSTHWECYSSENFAAGKLEVKLLEFVLLVLGS